MTHTINTKVQKNYKNGFTLAEVLITLGIIGVIAAMTIPTLISNTRSQQYRSRLKKTISTLSQAGKMAQAQYGFDYAGITKECGANAASEHPDKDSTICAILNGTLTGATYVDDVKNLKIKRNGKEENYNITPGQFYGMSPRWNAYKYHGYILADGTLITFISTLGKENGCSLNVGTKVATGDVTGTGTAWCYGFIDVNGTNLPNKEVSCSSGSDILESNKDCVVKNDAKHLTDIYPIRYHDGIVEPATASAKYVLSTSK